MELLKTMGTSPFEFPLKDIFRPSFSFFAAKWSELRQEKVELVKERFQKDANSVFILKDSKFGDDQLALLKTDHLEKLIKLNEDLVTGEAAIKESVEGALHSVKVLIEAIESSKIDQSNKLLSTALEGVKFQIEAVFKRTVIFANAPEDKESPDLTEEESKLFEKLEAEEEE